ncbi:50S ribosomal protein L22 [Candidatus Micrarchaeota archaeon]|nr:50S ribosomal protein L22 [Candidatus Micrarchaeota archaeon]
MYSYKFDDTVVGKARLEDIDASFKDLVEVCSNIRRRKVADALALLEKASKGEVPIRYRKYISNLGHRRELGGRPGRYPKKAAGFVLAALKSAMGSAKSKGLSEDLVIVHAAANKKNVLPRLASKGRRSRSFFETARIEIVVSEVSSKKETVKTTKKAQKKPKEVEAKAKSIPKDVPKTSESKPAVQKASEVKKAEKKPEAPETKNKAVEPKQEAETKNKVVEKKPESESVGDKTSQVK